MSGMSCLARVWITGVLLAVALLEDDCQVEGYLHEGCGWFGLRRQITPAGQSRHVWESWDTCPEVEPLVLPALCIRKKMEDGLFGNVGACPCPMATSLQIPTFRETVAILGLTKTWKNCRSTAGASIIASTTVPYSECSHSIIYLNCT